MKYGIYYAYWEKEWNNNFIPYIEKCKRLGFDILEIACGAFDKLEEDFFISLRKKSEESGIILTGGYGPRPEHNIASDNSEEIKKTFLFYKDVFHKMELAGIDRIGGALYSFWPVDYSEVPDKKGDWERSVRNMRILADMAEAHGITLNMEVLNRFEGYLLNEASEAVAYVKEVNCPNVKVMLDTFHMNIEEESITDAIRLTGNYLGHVHIGEANRRCPHPESRMGWEEIGKALKDINYEGYVVMEPFTQMGGQVGKDIRLWRDLSQKADITGLDKEAAESLEYIRKVMG